MQIISTVMEHWEEAKHFIALQDVKFNRKQYPKTHCNIIDHCKMRGSKSLISQGKFPRQKSQNEFVLTVRQLVNSLI